MYTELLYAIAPIIPYPGATQKVNKQPSHLPQNCVLYTYKTQFLNLSDAFSHHWASCWSQNTQR